MQQVLVREHGTLIQSVRKAASLLKAFDDGSAELGVAELSRRLHLHKSTVSRLLATLATEGLLERVGPGDKYRLGHAVARLARRVPPLTEMRLAAQPFLGELAERSGETVHLALLDGTQVLNVEQVSGSHLVRDSDWVGRHTPLHCVANGKALLAFQSTSEQERLSYGRLNRFTKRTITNKLELRVELARTRKRGYATARGEIEEGLNAVAAPIRNRAGETLAAVSISGPAYRLTPKRMAELGEMTVAMADKISKSLGFEP